MEPNLLFDLSGFLFIVISAIVVIFVTCVMFSKTDNSK